MNALLFTNKDYFEKAEECKKNNKKELQWVLLGHLPLYLKHPYALDFMCPKCKTIESFLLHSSPNRQLPKICPNCGAKLKIGELPTEEQLKEYFSEFYKDHDILFGLEEHKKRVREEIKKRRYGGS